MAKSKAKPQREFRETLGGRQNPVLPDVGVTCVLHPVKRPLKFKGQRVVASVHFGPNDWKRYTSSHGSTFRHPSLTLTTLNSEGGPDTYSMDVRFQTQCDTDISRSKSPRGFQAMPGWCVPYSFNLDHADAAHASDLDALAFVATTIQRARDAYWDRNRERRDRIRERTGSWPNSHDDAGSLLPVMVGLRLIGVEVRIHNPTIAERRALRAPEGLISVEEEIANIEASGSDPYPRKSVYQ